MALTAADVARMSPAAQKQIAAKLVGEAQRKERKYRNEPTVSHGITFDSKKEARRYEELLLMLKAGTIRRLKLQVDFTLQEAYTTPEGERVQAMRYRADFAYERPTRPDAAGVVYWIPVVEDVKSKATATDKYKLKKKLMLEKFNITVKEV